MKPKPTEPIRLQELAGDSWEGWTLHDGRLNHPTWRKGFTGSELAAMWFECQLVRELQRQVRDLTAALEVRLGELHRAERRAWWYRTQLVNESKFGFMWISIDRGNDAETAED
jgi:hypothetical protein